MSRSGVSLPRSGMVFLVRKLSYGTAVTCTVSCGVLLLVLWQWRHVLKSGYCSEEDPVCAGGRGNASVIGRLLSPETEKWLLNSTRAKGWTNGSRVATPAPRDGSGRHAEFPWNFLIDEQDFCSGRTVDVVNIILCHPMEKLRRNQIRAMWGSPSITARTRLVPLFILGVPMDQEVQVQVNKESERNKDILQVDVRDSYLNLTLKTMAALYWVSTRCPDIHWLLKSDLDIVPNVFMYMARANDSVGDYLCVVLPSKPVCRNFCVKDAWNIDNITYPEPYYPRYCNGPIYMIRGSVVKAIVDAANWTHPFIMEDVYFTGILAKKLNLRHQRIVRNKGETYHYRSLSIPRRAELWDSIIRQDRKLEK